MSVTIKDIAMLAGVSHQAVSAALNGNGSSRVSAAKKEKILKIARELNYVPNAIARKFVGGNTKAIGIVSSMDPGWNMHLAAEICSLLIAHGYNTLVSHFATSNYCASDSLMELISRGVDGVIILNSDKKELRKKLSVPYVFGSHNNREGYDVAVNNESTGYIGTKHLLDHGHKKVMYLLVMMPGNERLNGWRRAHQEKGIEVTDRDIVAMRDLDGRFDRLLDIMRKQKISAVFCSNDYIAGKLVKALLEHGVRVPEDIAVLGCDGQSFTEFCPVSISTVIQPIRPQAEAIVDLLIKRINADELHSELAGIDIEPQLWLGGSCGCCEKPIEELYRINTLASLEKNMMLNFNRNILEEGK